MYKWLLYPLYSKHPLFDDFERPMSSIGGRTAPPNSGGRQNMPGNALDARQNTTIHLTLIGSYWPYYCRNVRQTDRHTAERSSDREINGLLSRECRASWFLSITWCADTFGQPYTLWHGAIGFRTTLAGWIHKSWKQMTQGSGRNYMKLQQKSRITYDSASSPPSNSASSNSEQIESTHTTRVDVCPRCTSISFHVLISVFLYYT